MVVFDWEDEFSEKLLEKGLDLEDEVTDIDVGFNLVSGHCEDNLIIIELDDEFKIKSLECDCGKKKCYHMTALLYASQIGFEKDIFYEDYLGDLNKDKLIDFLKDHLNDNEDVLSDFKFEFNEDLINIKDIPLDIKLYWIFEGIDWDEKLTKFVKTDLTKLYEDEYYLETFYLIDALFDRLIDKYSFDEENNLEECWLNTVDLIYKLYEKHPKLIIKFLSQCSDRNYDTYPVFESFNKLNRKIYDDHTIFSWRKLMNNDNF